MESFGRVRTFNADLSGDSDFRGTTGDVSLSCALRRSILDNVVRGCSSGLDSSLAAIRMGDGEDKCCRREMLAAGRIGVIGGIGGGVRAPCRFRMLVDVADTRRCFAISRSSRDNVPDNCLVDLAATSACSCLRDCSDTFSDDSS